jgi:hypothetical protein
MLVAVETTLLGLAAILTAIGGIVTTIWGVIKSRREGKEQADEKLRDNLRKCRDEAERIAEELHRTKMGRFTREG